MSLCMRRGRSRVWYMYSLYLRRGYYSNMFILFLLFIFFKLKYPIDKIVPSILNYHR